jgi:hypothetical protein
MGDAESERLREAAALLIAVADGQMDADAAMVAWPFESDRRGTVGQALHELARFADDEDIRARDAGHAEHRRQELRKLARKLQPQPGPPGTS